MGDFDTFADDDVRDLIAEYPLAWVIAPAADPPAASLLPLVGSYDGAGRLTGLIGHLARVNPLLGALCAGGRALILFNGPQGYVSPAHATQRSWGPTWNYAQLTIEADLVFDEAGTAAALDTLIEPMERGRSAPWTGRELGDRYSAMLGRIIGFHAAVVGLRGKFKLGQDERVGTLRAILDNHPDPALARWMRRMNAHRL